MKLPLSRGFMSAPDPATTFDSIAACASVSVSDTSPSLSSTSTLMSTLTEATFTFSSSPHSPSKPHKFCMCASNQMKMTKLRSSLQYCLPSSRNLPAQHRFEKCVCSSSSGICAGSGISKFVQCVLTCGLLLLLAAGNAIVEGALRNVNLIIEPPAVRRGQHAIVRCLYDLEGTPLYSAKFYRGQLEFYRYTPGEFPNTKVFPFPGIHVDVTNSNATQVLIRNVGFGLSGNFSCEVTADAPLFSTATATGIMQVVELPEKRPQLFTEQARYEPGDVLRANCSTPPSRPRAELKFTINNMVVGNSETEYIRTIDNLVASRINLKMQLQAAHFSNTNPSLLHGNGNGGAGYGYGGLSSGYGINSVHGFGSVGGGGGAGGVNGNVGSLVLRCTAQIGDLYQEYKEIELGTPQKDPVPARVTLSSGSNFFSSYFSNSSSAGRKFAPPTGIIMLLMVTASIAATTTITLTTTTATTTRVIALTIVNVFVDLYVATFVCLSRAMKCAQQKLSGEKYVLEQGEDIKKSRKKKKKVSRQQQPEKEEQQQRQDRSEQPQQQQQNSMHSFVSYYADNELAATTTTLR